jgi:hypothetical protein
MPNDHPAFRAGEHVRFADYKLICEAQDTYGVNGPHGRLMIHDVLSDDMTVHHGLEVIIKEVSTYHMGTILYEFYEIEGHWLEACIIDRDLDVDSEHEMFQPANLYYQPSTAGNDSEVDLVHIRSIQDGQVYCSFRKRLPFTESKKVAEVSEIRAKVNFETIYGFDGYYDPIPEE